MDADHPTTGSLFHAGSHFPHIRPHPSETALSFAARLAATHTGGRLVPFLNDLSIKSLDLARGEQAALSALCERADVPVDLILANTPVSIGKGRYRLRDEAISADFLSNPLTVFCPACLLEDDASGLPSAQVRLGRYDWPLRVVRTCSVHGIALIERRRRDWDDQFHELAVRVPERGGELEDLAAGAVSRSVSTLQAYAVGRLEGAAGPEWLDSQTLEQAVRATELLGGLVEFGSARKVSALTTDEWDQAGRTGFEFTSRGEIGIREALGQIQGTFRATGKRPLHRNVFGRLYEWLGSTKTAKEPGDIKRIVREHILQTVAVAPGESVLGQCLPERRLHTVASLARETELHPKTLGYVLMAKGLVPAEDSTGVFDAAAGREVAASVHRMVHVNSLPAALNCSRPQASALIDERILRPIATGEAGAPGRTQKAVDQQSLDAFLASLNACARLEGAVPAGMVSISKAAEKVKAPCADIVHLILGGFLSNVVAVDSVKGYAAIHVEPEEVMEAIRDNLPGLSPSQAAAKIGVPAQAVWVLTDHEHDEPAVLPSMFVQGRSGRHVIRRVDADVFEQFRAGYVKSGDIANQLEIARGEVERMLRQYRVQPAFSEAQIGVNLYRSEVLPSIFRVGSTPVAA